MSRRSGDGSRHLLNHHRPAPNHPLNARSGPERSSRCRRHTPTRPRGGQAKATAASRQAAPPCSSPARRRRAHRPPIHASPARPSTIWHWHGAAADHYMAHPCRSPSRQAMGDRAPSGASTSPTRNTPRDKRARLRTVMGAHAHRRTTLHDSEVGQAVVDQQRRAEPPVRRDATATRPDTRMRAYRRVFARLTSASLLVLATFGD